VDSNSCFQELAGLTNPAMLIFGARRVTRKGANLKLKGASELSR